MKDERLIPVIVGVTGHRDLVDEDIPVLRKAVRTQLRKLKKVCPNSPLVMLNSLAEGGDQLCAEVALEEGFELRAVLPMPLGEYEKDFEGDALERLQALVAVAKDVFVSPQIEEYRKGRDYLFRQAGIYVAQHCHFLLALWDGESGKPEGCGSAEAVDFKLKNSFSPQLNMGMRAANGCVIQISTQRRSAIGRTESGNTVFHGDREALNELLKATDAYNLDVSLLQGGSDAEAAAEDPVLARQSAVYGAADLLSVQNAKKHKRAIFLLSVAATVLTVSFLLYDEVDLHGFILLCGLMIAGLFAVSFFATRRRYLDKYLQYRVLAEGLRVQTGLRKAGSGAGAWELLSWSLQMDEPWIQSALAALAVGTAPVSKSSVLDSWIRDQKGYHEKAAVRTRKQSESNERIVYISLALSVFVYLAALFLELLYGGLLPGTQDVAPEVVRTVMKIVLGSLSAATLFAGSYYGKLSLEESGRDHERMAALYSAAEEHILKNGETEDFLLLLAKEELEENSRWYAYQSMNGPDINI